MKRTFIGHLALAFALSGTRWPRQDRTSNGNTTGTSAPSGGDSGGSSGSSGGSSGSSGSSGGCEQLWRVDGRRFGTPLHPARPSMEARPARRRAAVARRLEVDR